MTLAALLLLAAGRSDAANGTRVRGHGFSFDATAVLERRALPVNGSWRVRLHARARLNNVMALLTVMQRNGATEVRALPCLVCTAYCMPLEIGYRQTRSSMASWNGRSCVCKPLELPFTHDTPIGD